MRIIDEIVSDVKYKKYKDKFIRFRVSPVMATVARGDDGINIIKLVNSCSNYNDLKDSIIVDLLGPRENDFLIFSLLFGLFFDTFNLYSYMYINPELRRNIALLEPNCSGTRDFFKEKDNEISSYFEEEHGIDIDTYHKIIDSLFEVRDYDGDFYNNPIIIDISKILMGWTISHKFTSCRELIELFDRENEINRKKTV